MPKNRETSSLPLLTLSKGIYQHESDEEYYFAAWCRELLDKGILLEAYRPEPIVISEPLEFEYSLQMKTKQKECSFVAVKSATYKPDMWLVWNPDYHGFLHVNFGSLCKANPSPNGKYCKEGHHLFYTFEDKCIIDVKGTFQPRNHIPFSRTKQLCATKGWHVQKIIPLGNAGLFSKTFAPKEYLYTRVLKKRRSNFKSLSEFLKENGETKITID